ncbi:hypothetical protein [Candidatus Neptunochlamydia vexilliferae]|uniref:DNA-directed DNA polymerase n=1 Tax=Candidatus Neptunichlamydia vexilliferae TaxID=1651774 RepID=A0ABS0AYI0_9BACT|nr:hypothetical protein [Candidatus Neptunochlamydia vexilliferae]MBF5058657.1 hypothetical protein [Candidatus Neptunochlamydia vexilliferae]
MSHLKPLLENTPHAILVESDAGVDAFARTLLKTDKKEPPDLRHLYPEGKSRRHPIEAIRTLIEEANLLPFESEHKVFIIHEADRMLPSSSNALLKILEEPPSFVTIILISAHPEALLPTITSRCFQVPSDTKVTTDRELSDQMFRLGMALLQKDFLAAKELAATEEPQKALAYLFSFYRDLHLLRAGGNPELLFYKNKQETLETVEGELPSLESIEEKIERASEAVELNLSLASALAIF